MLSEKNQTQERMDCKTQPYWVQKQAKQICGTRSQACGHLEEGGRGEMGEGHEWGSLGNSNYVNTGSTVTFTLWYSSNYILMICVLFYIQLTLKQDGFELHGSTYSWIFFQ